MGALFNALLFYSISLYLIPQFALKKKVNEFILWLCAFTLGITLIETFIDFFFLIYIFSSEEEPFYSQFLINGLINFFFMSVAMGYGFTKNWLINIKKEQELNREKLTAELNFLKTQLNPHFLFNVLNMAFSSATRSGDERTADIIEKLSGLMRYMIYESNVDKIDMEREVEYIRTYIDLQKMRFSNDIPVTINFNITGNPIGLRIAPLILISFIENAFKYGVKLEKKSNIDIAMSFHNNEMEFSISNPIFKSIDSMGSKHTGIGINNTKKRLAILYPNQHELFINNDGEIFSVKLLINLN